MILQLLGEPESPNPGNEDQPCNLGQFLESNARMEPCASTIPLTFGNGESHEVQLFRGGSGVSVGVFPRPRHS